MKITKALEKELQNWQLCTELSLLPAAARCIESYFGQTGLIFKGEHISEQEQIHEPFTEMKLPASMKISLGVVKDMLEQKEPDREWTASSTLLHLARKEPREPEEWSTIPPAWLFLLKGEEVCAEN